MLVLLLHLLLFGCFLQALQCIFSSPQPSKLGVDRNASRNLRERCTTLHSRPTADAATNGMCMELHSLFAFIHLLNCQDADVNGTLACIHASHIVVGIARCHVCAHTTSYVHKYERMQHAWLVRRSLVLFVYNQTMRCVCPYIKNEGIDATRATAGRVCMWYDLII
jgi:hypothetical protein